MNLLKKYLGIVWMVAGPILVVGLIRTARIEIELKPTTDTIIQWSVFVIVFLPIAIGLMIFGYYAWRGEYEELEEAE